MKQHLEFVSDWWLIANMLSYCICLIHAYKITKQALKQKFENDSAAMGVYTKNLISRNHFHVSRNHFHSNGCTNLVRAFIF